MDYQTSIERFSLMMEALEDENPENVVFDPRVLYNTYYAILVAQGHGKGKPNPSDLSIIAEELQEYYLDKYKIILSRQLLKYWKRKRVSPKFQKMIDKYQTFEDLIQSDFKTLYTLMENTFRSDMSRLNVRWIDLASNLTDLANLKINPKNLETVSDVLLKLDRINNIVHNTGDKMLDKFENGRRLLATLNEISKTSPNELRKKVSDKFLREM